MALEAKILAEFKDISQYLDCRRFLSFQDSKLLMWKIKNHSDKMLSIISIHSYNYLSFTIFEQTYLKITIFDLEINQVSGRIIGR